MGDHLVALPAGVTAVQKKRDLTSILAIIGCFSHPDRFTIADLERDLTLRFAVLESIGARDIVAWFADAAIGFQDQPDLTAHFNDGLREPLHQLLMAGNDAGSVQLIGVADGSTLIDAATGRPLMESPGAPVLLLRVGYNENGEAFYYASLPGYSHSTARIAWTSLAASVLSGVLVVAGPRAPVDVDTATNALHIMQQALATANQAHSDLATSLGLPVPPGAQSV